MTCDSKINLYENEIANYRNFVQSCMKKDFYIKKINNSCKMVFYDLPG